MQQSSSFDCVKCELVSTELGEPALSPQARETKQRLLPAGEHKLRPLRDVREQLRDNVYS